MSATVEFNPILNSPYVEPGAHYHTDFNGALDYEDIRPGRRIFTPEIHPIPVLQDHQRQAFDINETAQAYGDHLVNLLRKEVRMWREAGYPHVTRVTQELLTFWFDNPERTAVRKLFFCQQEAVETAIWLNEVAPDRPPGPYVLRQIQEACNEISADPELCIPRIAFKMATGSGKTVVMAMLILYHYFNRLEYRNDTRFADYFLLVTPGITIRDRLNVLKVDTEHFHRAQANDYYHERDLIPRSRETQADGLNARIVITNYHQFEPKILKGNKQSPFDGKIDADGKKHVALEDESQVIRRVLGGFKQGRRILILNDEAHHCYLPKAKGNKTEGENTVEENARAAVWYRGLLAVTQRFKLANVYDLSATPYYLSGSGYEPYSLFGWVVTDFGLTEAIESGLVKIPYIPVEDTSLELDEPMLRNLYEHVRAELPRKGQKRKKKEAKEEGTSLQEERPNLPSLVKNALSQFYEHYERILHGDEGTQVSTDEAPPVFIVVCNNTSVSKEVYKHIAGYETTGEPSGGRTVIPGMLDEFSNYDTTTHQPKRKAPTILIDSDALENADQIDEEFREVFAPEIELFKREYAREHGHGAAETITEAQILREVVNTVGKPNTLGGHVRCVVSVSMLTEGWDANTVTHILGLRAFGSQLLCEQVAGRALRRRNYYLQGYDKSGNPTSKKPYAEKFPPEYAYIIGVPFRFFKAGGKPVTTPPRETTHVRALEERADLEITFPNIQGYRIEQQEENVVADFSRTGPYVLDGGAIPSETTLQSAFSPEVSKLSFQEVLEDIREQQVVYDITHVLLRKYWTTEEGRPDPARFAPVRTVVEDWYRNHLHLKNVDDPAYKKLVYYEPMDRLCTHIYRAIAFSSAEDEAILPVLNHYNPFGSTRYVSGATIKETVPTTKSHVNVVVMDSGWEGKAAKTFDMMPEVIAYVKNNYLGFTIPYIDRNGMQRDYYPDFIVRCRRPDGEQVNVIVEVTGMNTDKEEKRQYVVNRWLPAANNIREKYETLRWLFAELTGDPSDFREQLREAVR